MSSVAEQRHSINYFFDRETGQEMIRANFWDTDGGAHTQTFHHMDPGGAQGWINNMRATDGRRKRR